MSGHTGMSNPSPGHDDSPTTVPPPPAGSDLVHTPFVPFNPNVGMYTMAHGVAMPFHFTDWREESMAWKASCYLHGGLNPSSTYRVRGPEALDFLASLCVNSFANFPIGRGKHAIMCRDDGLLLMHGVLLRLGEEDFITYWLSPYIQERLEQGGYDAVGEDLTGTSFMFQVAGPRSLEVLEAATGRDLHDLTFMGHRPSSVAGRDVTVLRMGMSGTLSYELHGAVEDAERVYAAVLEAGQPFGIRQMGWGSFMLNHTESGFQQVWWHFLPPPDDPSEDDSAAATRDVLTGGTFELLGSLGPDVRKRWCTPVDLGWAKTIAFDHEFRGRAALERQVANPRRTTVTLVWNAEDVLDVIASQLRPGEAYQWLDFPFEQRYFAGGLKHIADLVRKDGMEVGFTSGRVYTYYSREMLSLAVLDVRYAAPGTEVVVVWGDPGTRQKEIRAVVAPVPYVNMTANRDFDVASIPRVNATA